MLLWLNGPCLQLPGHSQAEGGRSVPLVLLEQVLLQRGPQRVVVPACSVVALHHPVAAESLPWVAGLVPLAVWGLLHRRLVVVVLERLVAVLLLVQEPLVAVLPVLAVPALPSWPGLYRGLGIGPPQISLDLTSLQHSRIR